MALLHVEHLSKAYRMGSAEVNVLRDVSLAVASGESVAIIGASGAGKSTLLHVLGGLDLPSTGRVAFKGADLYGLSERRRAYVRARQIGFVFQFYHLLPELDVIENVVLPAMNHNRGWPGRLRSLMTEPLAAYAAVDRTRAVELLKAVGLWERRHHLPSELSGGEQQRAAVARALINGPELVLADEPTGNLDSATGGQVLDVLFALVREQRQTLILVTHNEKVASRCDRILELKDGGLMR